MEILNDYRVNLSRDQLHVSRYSYVTPTLVRSPSPIALSKPEGFWTSSAIECPQGFTSHWYEFAKNRLPNRTMSHGFILSIKPIAFVFSLKGIGDFKQWCIRNERLEIDSFGSKTINPWNELTRYVDGVHTPSAFGDWPAESTVWSNGTVLKRAKTVVLF